MNKAGYRALTPKVIMILFFVGCLVYPILQVLCNITPEALKTVMSSVQFQGALVRSLTAKYPVDMSLSFAHYGTVIFKSGFRYLFNSLLIASVVAVVGVAVAYV